MNKPKIKNKKVFIAILALLVLIAIAITFWTYSNHKIPFLNNDQKSSKSISTVPGSVQQDSNSLSKDGTIENSSNIEAPNTTTPDKPILIKSSGNNGPVPSNVIIEFVCQSTAGTNCKILLSNQNNSIVELSTQAVKDNGRGQYFTSWEWKSQSGTWQVYAVAINQQGNSAESDKQTLEVK